MSDASQPQFLQHDELATTPDHLVLLVPCPWEMIQAEALEEIFAEHWQEIAHVTWVEGEQEVPCAEVSFESANEVVVAKLFVEPPLDGLEGSLGMSVDPLTQAEALLLRDHRSLWRIVLPAGKRLGRRSMKRASQLMATFIEAGACAIFLPGVMRLHSARFVRKETMDLHDPQGMTNLFVGAWHADGWMRTRGLTAFELPEIEVSAEHGLNAAYFHLMDISANMLMQMGRFPSGAELQIGPRTLRVEEADHRFEEAPDPLVPSNGCHGVQRLLAR